MSGLWTSIRSFFFGTQVKPASQHGETGATDHQNGWTKSGQKYHFHEVIKDYCDQLDGRGEKEKSGDEFGLIANGYSEMPSPESNHHTDVNGKWDQDYSDFTKTLIKAAGLDDLNNGSINDGIEEENSFHSYATNESKLDAEAGLCDFDSSALDDSVEESSDSDSLKIDLEEREMSPILPDLSSDESDEEDTLKDADECSSPKEDGEEPLREPLESLGPENELPKSSPSLPSMPDLGTPEVEEGTRILSVTPVDNKTPSPVTMCKNVDYCHDGLINDFLVMEEGMPLTPFVTKEDVNQFRRIQSERTAQEIPMRAKVPGVDAIRREVDLPRSMTLREMYDKFNKVPIRPVNARGFHTNPRVSPKTQCKKLLDVSRHSRLVYSPDDSPNKTPPNSPSSQMSSSFSTPKAGGITHETPSPQVTSVVEGGVRSSPNCYMVRVVKANDVAAMASTLNRKFMLVKSKVDTGLSKDTQAGSIVSANSSANRPAYSGVKALQCKKELSTPIPVMSRLLGKPGAMAKISGPTGASFGGSDVGRGVRETTPLKMGDRSKNKKSVKFLEREVEAKTAVAASPSSRAEKRSFSVVARCDQGPSKKKRLEVLPMDTPRRPLRSNKFPTPHVRFTRSMQDKKVVVSYK